jgi:HEAT repeat protein
MVKMESVDTHLLVDEAIKDHRKIRNIVSLLYDEDITRRFTAVKALGEIAKREPELMKQRWERIFRSFDDTMSCWGAAEALGEIARNMPRYRRKIVLFLRVFRKDDCSCQGYIWGMCRICQVDRDWINDFAPELEGFLNSSNVCIRGQALWALGELRIKEATGRIKDFLLDEGETWYYENEAVYRKRIGTIVEEALRKLEIE